MKQLLIVGASFAMGFATRQMVTPKVVPESNQQVSILNVHDAETSKSHSVKLNESESIKTSTCSRPTEDNQKPFTVLDKTLPSNPPNCKSLAEPIDQGIVEQIPADEDLLQIGARGTEPFHSEQKFENPDGTVSLVGTMADGNILTKTFDKDVLVSEILQEGDQIAISRSYYENGLLKGITRKNSEGRLTMATFNTTGALTGKLQELSDGRKVSVSYDENGKQVDRWIYSTDGETARRF